MGLRNLQNVKAIVVDNIEGDIPSGFNMATINNMGVADATLSQNGEVWTLPAGQVYNFGYRMDNNAWHGVHINAIGTKVEVTYD